jgi:hypothetical protein
MRNLIASLAVCTALSACGEHPEPHRYQLIPAPDRIPSINQHAAAWLLDTQTGRVSWCTAFTAVTITHLTFDTVGCTSPQ